MTTVQPHIEQAENGTRYVAGTPYKVKLLIRGHVYWGMGADEICAGHSGLTLGDAHAVLTYFYDNEQEIRQKLDADLKRADELRRQFPNKFIRQKLIDRRNAYRSVLKSAPKI